MLKELYNAPAAWMGDYVSEVDAFFNSKISIRHLPPEISFEELKEEFSEFLPFIDHFHFIPGKSPTFYPSSGNNTSSSLNTRVRTSRGVITFSSHSKKPVNDESSTDKEIESPEELLNQKIALEEHYVNILGGRLSSAHINFTTPESVLDFTKKFNGKIFESNRGRLYRAIVKPCTLPSFHYKELSESISSSHGSLDNSVEFKEWLESRKSQHSRPQASLSFEQQTELMLEQERQLLPWKYDPNFFQNTSLMSFIQKKAILEKERTSEKLRQQKSSKQTKEKTKIKKNSISQTTIKPKDSDNPPKPKIKARKKLDQPSQTQHSISSTISHDSPNKKTFSTSHDSLTAKEFKESTSDIHETPKKIKIFTTSKSK